MNDADEVTIIDFPQMVSVAHPNGAELFARDVAGVGRFFRKKLGYMPEHDAALPRVAPDFEVRLLYRIMSKQPGGSPGLWRGCSCGHRPCSSQLPGRSFRLLALALFEAVPAAS